MARLSKTGSKASKAKARKASPAKSRKSSKAPKARTAKTGRRTFPATTLRKPRTASDLTKELKEAREQQAATAAILKAINASPGDLTTVFETILEKTHSLCDVASGSLQLYEGGYVRTVATRGFNTRWKEHLRRGYKIDDKNREGLEAVLPRHVADMGEILDRSPNPLARIFVEIGGFRTFLGLPLLKDGKAIGRIVAAREEVRPFTDEQIALLQGFADQAVIAIDNARLFNETKEALEQQKASADILSVISNSVADAQPVFDKILVSCKHLFGGDELDVLLVDEQGQLSIAAYIGDSHDVVAATFPAPVERTPAGRAIRERRVLHWPDLLGGKDVPGVLRKMAKLIGYRSMVFAPMLWEGRGIGAIGVARSTGPFKPKELAMIQTFADQAVIAIQNARLFNETKEALEYQRATSEVLQVIGRSMTSAQPVFERIVDSIERLFDHKQIAIFLAPGDGLLHLAARRGFNMEMLDSLYPLPIEQTSAPIVLGARRQVYYADVLHNPDAPESIRRAAQRTGNISNASTPMLWKGQGIGVIAVTREPNVSFSETELSLLRTFADQAVIAIENVRLFDDVQAKTRDLTESLQQQTATADVLKIISRSAFDLDTVLETLISTAVRLCNCGPGQIFRREGGVYRYAASRMNVDPDYLQHEQTAEIKPGQGTLIGRVALSKRTVMIADAWNDPEYEDKRAARIGNVRAMLGVPLLRDGEPIGAFALARSEPIAFSEREVELVTSFADQAVVAIENARLFNEVQARTKELSASLDSLRIAQDRLVQTEKLASLGQLTAGIAHEIKNPLNFINNFSALSAELIDELNEVLAVAPLDQKMRGDVGELAQMLKSNLEKVVQHGNRADSIVKNMLLHSRDGSGEHRPADINALLDESLNLAYHGARAEKPEFNITLRRELDPDAGAIDVFPQEITRAFINLISNGFYAASKRKAENGETDFEPILSAGTTNLGNHVEIRIRDNGTGIPPEVKEKIFNPFFTTKPAGEGTGLGLSMSYDIIVKQHGGRIEVDTQPGQFTEFTIVLPRQAIIRK